MFDAYISSREGSSDRIIEGEVPVFRAGNRHDGSAESVEIELTDEQNELSSVEITADPVEMPRLEVGIIGIERDTITGIRNYEFDSSRDLNQYAEDVARYLQRVYPTTEVAVYVHDEYLRGPRTSGAVQHLTLANDVRIELDDGGQLGDPGTNLDGETFAIRKGDRIDNVSIDAPFNVCLGILPKDKYFGGNLAGVTPTLDIDNRKAYTGVLAEIDRIETAAHEIGHYLLGPDFYEQPILHEDYVNNETNPHHTGLNTVSTKYDLEDGDFDIGSGYTSIMYGFSADDTWADSALYQQCITDGFEEAEKPGVKPRTGGHDDDRDRGEVVMVTGEFDENDMDAEINQYIPDGDVDEFDEGDATISVVDANGATIATHTAVTSVTSTEFGDADGSSVVDDVLVAYLPLPDEAVELEIEAEVSESNETVSTRIDPLSESLRNVIDRLPSQAVMVDGTRETLASRVDMLEQAIERKQFSAAHEMLKNIKQEIENQVRDDYERDYEQQPTKDELLTIVEMHLDRVSGQAGPARRR